MLSSPRLNGTVVHGPLVLSTQRSGSGAVSTLARKHMISNVKIPMDSNSDAVSVPPIRCVVPNKVWRLRPSLFLNDRRQLTDARSLSGSKREVPTKTFTLSATSLLSFPQEQNMTGINLLRPQIDIMKLPSASAPPHLRRDIILLSATFIEVKPRSFLSSARAKERRSQLFFDTT